jgi:glucan 1,3-beta-glucosidase
MWLIGTASEHAGIYQYSLVNAKNHYMGLIQTESVRVLASFRQDPSLMFLFQPYYQPLVSVDPPFFASTTYHDPSPLPKMAWGLNVKSSSNIFIFGAGHYAVRSALSRDDVIIHTHHILLQFFQNYNGTCVNNNTCQAEIVNIDAASSVSLYQLATVGVTDSLSINQQGEACFKKTRVSHTHLFSSAVLASAPNNEGTQSTITLWTSS